MNKLVAGAVALCIAVPSVFAGFDYFPVIEGGKGQATVGYYDGDFGLKIRYGLVENFELYSSVGTPGLETWPYPILGSPDYVLGARYQIMPLLAVFLDVGLPTKKGQSVDYNYLGFVPGINVSTNITEQFSIGSVAQLGVVLADTVSIGKKNTPILNLKVGVEADYQVSETICLWLAIDYVMGAMNMEKRGDDIGKREDNKIPEDAVQPSLGASFSNGDFGVGTMLGLSFIQPAHEKGRNDPSSKVKDGVGLWGGVEFTIGF